MTCQGFERMSYDSVRFKMVFIGLIQTVDGTCNHELL